MIAKPTVAKDAVTQHLATLSVAELSGLWRRHLAERLPDHLPR